ncbi:MAG TPA: diacylglycerol kinase family protein [Chloroflexota bacterium]|nr:diacylglycerol kinase family protein [Chloroflexota bacterium]
MPATERRFRPPEGGSLWQQERRSFGYAGQGIRHAWETQRHLRIHAGLGLLAVGLGLALGIGVGEWAALLTVMTVVIALELLNTVVEAAVDLASPQFHPKAKVAKDVAAGAVLVSAVGASLVGAVIFVPRLLAFVGR